MTATCDKYFPLTDLTAEDPAVNRWSPQQFVAYQLRDYMDIRARFGRTEGQGEISIARFMANRDTHLYGDLIIHGEAIRFKGTLAIVNVENGDIVSFHQGSAVGGAVARITMGGVFKAKRGFQGIGLSTTLTALMDDDTTYTPLYLDCSSLTIRMKPGPTLVAWGSFGISSTIRTLTINDGTNRAIEITAASATFNCDVIAASNGSLTTRYETSALPGSGRDGEIIVTYISGTYRIYVWANSGWHYAALT